MSVFSRLISGVAIFCAQRIQLCTWTVLLGLAAYVIYLPPETASAILIGPDSSEYAVCLANLFEHGRFGLTLNGIWYPSRYAPWFSLICLTPAYFLGLGDVLRMNLSILFFSLTVIFLIGRWSLAIGLRWWSFFPALVLLLCPDFVFFSRIVMTEIPYTAILILLGLAYVRCCNEVFTPKGAWKRVLVIGCLLALGGMVRVTMLPMAILFAWAIVRRCSDWKQSIPLLAVLALPILGYELMNMSYNACVFGSPSRGGYQFWLPVPFDYPHLVFKASYIIRNLQKLYAEPIWLVTCAMLLAVNFGGLYLRNNTCYLRFLEYIDAQVFVLAVVYGAYYWDDTRFFLPVTICLVPLFFAVWVAVFNRLSSKIGGLSLIGCFVVVCWAFLQTRPLYGILSYSRQLWLAQAQIAAQVLPEDSVVIQDGDPNVLDYFAFRNRRITLLPYNRAFDYVGAMTAERSISDEFPYPDPGMVFELQKIIPELVDRGTCRMPFPRIFNEDLNRVRQLVDQGVRVFLEQSVVQREDEWVPLQLKLNGVGLATRLLGVWEADSIMPSPFRSWYDRLLFRRVRMDIRPSITAVYHEIIRSEKE